MQIDNAKQADVTAIAQIHVDAWQIAYKNKIPDAYLDGVTLGQRESQWREAIARGTPAIAVARDTGHEVRGWVAWGASRDADVVAAIGEVWAIYVAPSYWSQGIGRCLWRHAIAQLQAAEYARVTVWLLSSNHRAMAFYAAMGLAFEPRAVKNTAFAGRQLQELQYSCSL